MRVKLFADCLIRTSAHDHGKAKSPLQCFPCKQMHTRHRPPNFTSTLNTMITYFTYLLRQHVLIPNPNPFDAASTSDLSSQQQPTSIILRQYSGKNEQRIACLSDHSTRGCAQSWCHPVYSFGSSTIHTPFSDVQRAGRPPCVGATLLALPCWQSPVQPPSAVRFGPLGQAVRIGVRRVCAINDRPI